MTEWNVVKEYEDITYHKADGMARIAFDRPEVRSAFNEKREPDFRKFPRRP